LPALPAEPAAPPLPPEPLDWPKNSRSTWTAVEPLFERLRMTVTVQACDWIAVFKLEGSAGNV
jgi:hypothetical protein